MVTRTRKVTWAAPQMLRGSQHPRIQNASLEAVPQSVDTETRTLAINSLTLSVAISPRMVTGAIPRMLYGGQYTSSVGRDVMQQHWL